jgi:hypothetical protein
MLKFFLLAFLVAINYCAFAQKSLYVYKLSIANNPSQQASAADIESTNTVLKKRLVNFNHHYSNLYFDKTLQQFIIEINTKIEAYDFTEWLLKPCKVSIYECYNFTEFKNLLLKDKSKTAVELSDDFYKLSLIAADDRVGYVSSVSLKTIANFNKTKAALQAYYGKYCRLQYLKKEVINNDDLVDLYALKNNEPKLEVNQVLDSAKLDFDERGYASLLLSFDSIGTKIFSNMSEKNIGKCLAIAVDEMVYLAPIVTGKITEGKLQISGNFSFAELQKIESLLNAGYLPLSLHIKK